MNKTMMILGGSALQVPAIKKAREMGYRVIVVDYDDEAVGFELADVKLVVSTLDKEEVYRQALIWKPDVVLTSTSDGPVRTAAYVNEKLGKKPDLSYEDSLCATIKSHMRQRLKENKVSIPEFYIVHDEKQFIEAAVALKGYCIVKPADNAGSRGVVLLEKRRLADTPYEDLPVEDKEELLALYRYSKENSRGKIVLVEELMTGPEVSVEAMTIEGETQIITITDKITTDLPYFVELGHTEPSRLSPSVQAQICALTLQAVKAIRLQNGPSHTEIKITGDGPKVVELAARLGGDFITSRLVPLSTGVDMVGESLHLACGSPVNLKKSREKGAAIRFIQGKEGIIKNIIVDEKLNSLAGLCEFVLYKKPGERSKETKSSNDRLGHVITCGETADEAQRIAQVALGLIRFEMEETPEADQG